MQLHPWPLYKKKLGQQHDFVPIKTTNVFAWSINKD